METDNSNSLQTTEQRILEAAEREFLQKGYAGARTTAIAEAAGVTHAMLHYYFRTKDKLFEQIVGSKMGLLRNMMLESIGNDSLPLLERLESAVCRHLDIIAANADLPRFMVCEVFGHSERMQVVFDKLALHMPQAIASLQRQIDDCAAAGQCRRVDARMLILDIVSLNIFSFMSAPMVNPLLGGMMENMDEFLALRKRENVETIMRKLKP